MKRILTRKTLLSTASAAVLACIATAALTTEMAAVPIATADPVRAQIEQMSESDVKRFYRACSDRALRMPLASGEAAVCSIAYEVLLHRHFDGDFRALLAWSQRERQ